MKPDDCQATRNRILALPDPRRPTDPLRTHLDGCASCRRWWDGVARLERLLAALPVPAAADRKAALVDEIAAAGPVIRARPSLAGRGDGWGFGFAAAWKPLAGLAAAVAVVAGGWLALKPGPRPTDTAERPRHPLLRQVVRHNTELAKAATPVERLHQLGGLADDLHAEVLGLARIADPDELNDVAKWYEKVVRDGLMRQAEKMPPLAVAPADRARELGALADRLEKAGGEATRLAGEAPPGAKPALERVSNAARDGQAKLRRLANGGV